MTGRAGAHCTITKERACWNGVGPLKAQVVDHLCTLDFVVLTKSRATLTICSAPLLFLYCYRQNILDYGRQQVESMFQIFLLGFGIISVIISMLFAKEHISDMDTEQRSCLCHNRQTCKFKRI